MNKLLVVLFLLVLIGFVVAAGGNRVDLNPKEWQTFDYFAKYDSVDRNVLDKVHLNKPHQLKKKVMVDQEVEFDYSYFDLDLNAFVLLKGRNVISVEVETITLTNLRVGEIFCSEYECWAMIYQEDGVNTEVRFIKTVNENNENKISRRMTEEIQKRFDLILETKKKRFIYN